MADLAELGFVVRTGELKDASSELDRVTAAGARAERGAQGVGRASDRMGQQIERSLAPLRYMQGLLGAIAAGAAVNFISRQLEAADAIGKAADVTNLGTTTLQEYQYALTSLAKLTKGEVDDSLRRFNRRLGLAREAAGPAKAAFDDMFGGVEQFDTTEAALEAVIARLAEVEDGATRAGLASLYFGDDAGPKLAAAIGKGTVAIEALKAEAHDLGLILEDDLIRNADQVRTEFDKASQVMGVQMMRAVNELSPLLLGLADGAVKVAQNMDVIMRVAGGVAVVLTARMVPGILATAAGLNGATLAARAFSTTMAFFGGPIGLAITAVAAGVYYLATRTTEADQAQQDYNAALDAADRYMTAARSGSTELAAKYREEADAALDAARQTLELERARVQAAIAAASVASNDPLDRFAAGTAGMTSGQAEQKRLQALEAHRAKLAEIDAQLARINEKQVAVNAAPTAGGTGTAVGGGPSADALKQYERLEASMRRQVALYGETTEAARIRYELEHGALQGLNAEQAKRLEDLAKELDAKARQDEMEELREKTEQRLQLIRDSLGSEYDMEVANYERKREWLATVNAEFFESEVERKLLLEELEAQHQSRLFDIQMQGQSSLLSQQLSFLKQMEAAEKASGARQLGIYTNAFAQITAAGAQHSKALFEINKVAGISNAVISTYQGAAKALELGWPLGPIAAAAIVASGMAQVAAISSTQYGAKTAPSLGATPAPPVAPIETPGLSQHSAPAQRIYVEFEGADDQRVSLREMREQIRRIKEENPDAELVF